MSIELLTPMLHRAVSPYAGIVHSLEECLHTTAEPALFRFACELAHSDAFLGASSAHLSGIGGAGTSRKEAAAAAVGEALERYSATYVPRERLVAATARELGAEAVAPHRFALFAAHQYETEGFPFRPFTDDSLIPWIEGVSLPDRRRAWLPAELVFLGDSVSASEVRIGYATSSGTACAESPERACVSGLCELLERDAFMIVWANRLSLPLLDWIDSDALMDFERRYFAPTGLEYAAVDLSCFHRLPIVLGVVRAPKGVDGVLGVGAGTAPTIERAWWKALAEAFASRSAGAKLALLRHGRAYGPGGADVVTFEDHIAYYADHRRAQAASFLDASEERVSSSAVPLLDAVLPEPQIAELCARIEEAGSSAYAVDVTSPDVQELGLSVIKVVAPELCPLDVPHSARFLGGRRLYEEPRRLGLAGGPLAGGVNPDPHPFP